MRVLVLSQFFPPEEPSGRAYELSAELVARGHQVTVLTGFPNYPTGKIYPGYSQRLWQRQEVDGIRVVRMPLYPNRSRSAVKRAMNYLSFAASATILGPMLSGAADVLWVYSPPLTVGLPACWLRLLRGVPMVYEIQDMWPETVVSTGMVNEGFVTRSIGRAAKFVYRRADAVSVISPGFKRNLIDKGVPAEKIHVIPNWADDAIYRPVPRDPALGREFGLTGRKNVIFAGNMGPAQGLETLIEAASQLRDRPDIRFVLIGDGISLPGLRAEVERLQLANVQFIGRQPAARMPEFLAWGDALLVQLRDDPLFRITLPSKSLAYLACGRPIISALAGDGADLIRETQSGAVCEPGDAGALARTVQEFMSLPEEKREEFGTRGRRAFLRQYTRRILVDRYEDLFRKLHGEADPLPVATPRRSAA